MRILILLSSILLAAPIDFKLNRSGADGENNLPSNGIIDMESPVENIIYVGTSAGLGKAIISENGDIEFSTISNEKLPTGGNPAIEVFENVIAVSGVTTYYSATTDSNEPMGTGVAYSLDNGNTWEFMHQPVVENPESGFYYQIEWGDQTIDVLAVTTEVNNVTYDLAINENYIYSTSWAGGLQRFNYTINNPEWEVIPLPMDDQDVLYCGDIDIDDYELNPKDPKDGGNHNHKGFSVYIDEDVIWVGTANGLNKGTFDGDCINWTLHHISWAFWKLGCWVRIKMKILFMPLHGLQVQQRK